MRQRSSLPSWSGLPAPRGNALVVAAAVRELRISTPSSLETWRKWDLQSQRRELQVFYLSGAGSKARRTSYTCTRPTTRSWSAWARGARFRH